MADGAKAFQANPVDVAGAVCDRWDDLIDRAETVDRDRSEAEAGLRVTAEHMATERARVLLTVTGTSAEQRSAQTAIALAAEGSRYQELAGEHRLRQAEVDEWARRAGAIAERMRLCRSQMAYLTAVIEAREPLVRAVRWDV